MAARRFFILSTCAALTLAGCSERTAPPQASTQQTPAPAAPLQDVCALVTAEEVAAIQGDAVKDTKKFEATEGGFSVSECHIFLEGSAYAVRIRLLQRGAGAEAADPRTAWNEGFNSAKLAAPPPAGREGSQSPPEPVPGLGDEAYWRGDAKNGALYVLKGNRYLRLTIGGKEDKETKLRKCSAIAAAALQRL